MSAPLINPNLHCLPMFRCWHAILRNIEKWMRNDSPSYFKMKFKGAAQGRYQGKPHVFKPGVLLVTRGTIWKIQWMTSDVSTESVCLLWPSSWWNVKLRDANMLKQNLRKKKKQQEQHGIPVLLVSEAQQTCIATDIEVSQQLQIVARQTSGNEQQKRSFPQNHLSINPSI